MIREHFDLSWIANGRVDGVDRETLSLLKRAGCHMLKFGVESGSDTLLKNYQKGITIEQTRTAFRAARNAGLDTHAHIVFGGPGETLETIDDTIAFAKELAPFSASFGILTPYPGTQLFDEVARKFPEILDGTDSTMENLHVQGFYSKSICGLSGPFLLRKIKEAYRRFYFRPSYCLQRLKGIETFEELMILTIAGLNIFSFAATGKK